MDDDFLNLTAIVSTLTIPEGFIIQSGLASFPFQRVRCQYGDPDGASPPVNDQDLPQAF